MEKNFIKEEDIFIVTHSGIKFNPFIATEEDIDINDIAHSLSLICRYNGHIDEFYSVAQHSTLVSLQCSPKNRLWGLLHDATEAYIHDIMKPLKRTKQFEFYCVIEERLMGIIAKRFGLKGTMPAEIKEIDTRMLFTEKRDLIYNKTDWGWRVEPYDFKIEAYAPFTAKVMFLDRFGKLTS